MYQGVPPNCEFVLTGGGVSGGDGGSEGPPSSVLVSEVGASVVVPVVGVVVVGDSVGSVSVVVDVFPTVVVGVVAVEFSVVVAVSEAAFSRHVPSHAKT